MTSTRERTFWYASSGTGRFGTCVGENKRRMTLEGLCQRCCIVLCTGAYKPRRLPLRNNQYPVRSSLWQLVVIWTSSRSVRRLVRGG